MDTCYGTESFPRARRPVVSLGVFDGVHRGHQAVLAALVAAARTAGAPAAVLTLDRHPRRVLHGAEDRSLCDLARRLELLAAADVDLACVLPFDAALAAMPAARFAREVLGEALGARAVVLGYNTRFGRGAEGDAALLGAVLGPAAVAVTAVPARLDDGAPISSTRIRALLAEGRLAEAARLLGRPPELCGQVVSGAGRGRTLGVPTANLAPGHALLVPRGVYAARAVTAGGVWGALLNVGVAPTFGGGALRAEAHLLGFTGDLRHTRLRLELLEKLREEQRFDGPAELVEQIARDRAAFLARWGDGAALP